MENLSTWLSPHWSDYELLDFGHGYRLEKFGEYTLIRPDARALAKPVLSELTWQQADAKFLGKEDGKGEWQLRQQVPEKWLLQWNELRFWTKLTPLKHTGVFPEQSVQWKLLQDVIKPAVDSGKAVKMLNLFAYTGMATLAAASAGAEVVTVDASKPAMNWFRENQTVSNLLEKPVRMILEDVVKFVEREIKRGNTYDIIMMDPPAYGNGPKGEKWQFAGQFPELIRATRQLVSKEALLLLINTYTDSATEKFITRGITELSHGRPGKVEIGKLALETRDHRQLSTGSYAFWKL